MNEFGMLQVAEPRKVLEHVIREKIPAIVSYLSNRKWYVEKVLFTEVGANSLNARLSGDRKPHPINIQIEQPVGVSLKHRTGKIIFDTKVLGLEPSAESNGGGKLVLAVPDRIQIIERRKYFRVNVPRELKVDVLLWHRRCSSKKNPSQSEKYQQGRLVDISAGGIQIAIDASQEPDFKKGQFIGIQFTPMPYEKPLMFNAQIRNVVPTADRKSICLGLQLVGLEASQEGCRTLSRLVRVVEQYHKMNQSSIKQHDLQTTSSQTGLV
ncbi:flagellar brake protein [Planctomycetota bacterium]